MEPRYTAEVTAVLSSVETRIEERSDEKTAALKAKLAKVERGAVDAARRHAEDVRRVEHEHQVKASKLLGHSAGEQKRLKQHHVKQLSIMDQERKKHLEALKREHRRALAAHDEDCRGILGAAKALLPPKDLKKSGGFPTSVASAKLQVLSPKWARDEKQTWARWHRCSWNLCSVRPKLARPTRSVYSRPR